MIDVMTAVEEISIMARVLSFDGRNSSFDRECSSEPNHQGICDCIKLHNLEKKGQGKYDGRIKQLKKKLSESHSLLFFSLSYSEKWLMLESQGMAIGFLAGQTQIPNQSFESAKLERM